MPPIRPALLSLLLLPASLASAQDFSVSPLGRPVPFEAPVADSPGAFEIDAALESSAVEPAGDGRYLILAHDKAVPLRIVEAATAREVGTLSSPRFPAETPKSSKWEAMARDSEGVYYVAGSHSGKTEDEREQHRRLVRFRLVDGPDGLPKVDDASVVSWRLDAGLARALRSFGVPEDAASRRKIEGLTIREHDGRRELVVGLREPDDLARGFVADVTAVPADGAGLEFSPLFAFDPGSIGGVRRQLTSLEYVPAWRGIAVVTATEDDANAFHGNTLWFVPDAAVLGGTITPTRVWEFEPTLKAEGLAVLPSPAPGVVRLVIAYDNDAHVTGAPGRLQFVDVRRASGE